MPAVATFDTLGHGLTLQVCDAATCPLATALGVRWGRWPERSCTSGAAAVEIAYERELAHLRASMGPCGSERLHLGSGAPQPGPQWRQEIASETAGACLILAGTALLTVRTSGGFTGLLCEAGDWVVLPAGVPHVFDIGEAADPGVDVYRLCAGARGWFPFPTARPLPESLPGLDAFVLRLLSELGEELQGE